MGYVRNRTAAALKEGRHQVIGVLLHPMGAQGNEMTQSILGGIAKELSVYDYRLELGFCYSLEEFKENLDRMGQAAVDALVVCGMPKDEWREPLLEIVATGMPVVTVYSRPLTPEIPNVLCDESKILYLSTKHLIELGCRRIAQLAYWLERSAGYERALAEHDIPYDDQLVYWTNHTDFEPQIGEDGVASLFFRGIEFDGLVCQVDVYAIGAMRAFLRKGLRIPEDVKIAGVDNSPYCRYTDEPLTRVSLYERSREAVRLAMECLEGKNVASVEVEPTLVPRASTVGRSHTPTADIINDNTER